jgi:rhodanese-related sulfurtransferase
VQETDHQVPVRGARIVLADDDGVRASMSASWLAQMGWEVYVSEAVPGVADFTETAVPAPAYPPVTAVTGEIAPAELAALLRQGDTALIDVTTSANYVKRHIPGAWHAIRAQLANAIDAVVPASRRYVLTCGSSLLARYAAADLRALLDARGKGDVDVWCLRAATPHGSRRAWKRRPARPVLPRRAPTATDAPTRAPTHPLKPCRPTWTGSSAWSRNWGATARITST